MQSLQAALDESISSQQPLIFTRAEAPFTITHVNAAWEAVCGYRAHEAVGQTCRILQGPDTSREALSQLRSALAEHRVVSVRLLNYTRYGMAFLNDLTVMPLSDDGVSVTHFKGIICAWRPPEALPEYPRAFETSKEAQSTNDTRKRMPTTLHEALSSSEFAAVVTEREPPFRITHVNDKWCSLCGYLADEAVGQTLRMLQGPGTCQLTLQALRQAAVVATPITVRLLNFTKVSYSFIFRVSLINPLTTSDHALQDKRPFMNTLHMMPLAATGSEPTHLLGILCARHLSNDKLPSPAVESDGMPSSQFNMSPMAVPAPPSVMQPNSELVNSLTRLYGAGVSPALATQISQLLALLQPPIPMFPGSVATPENQEVLLMSALSDRGMEAQHETPTASLEGIAPSSSCCTTGHAGQSMQSQVLMPPPPPPPLTSGAQQNQRASIVPSLAVSLSGEKQAMPPPPPPPVAGALTRKVEADHACNMMMPMPSSAARPSTVDELSHQSGHRALHSGIVNQSPVMALLQAAASTSRTDAFYDSAPIAASCGSNRLTPRLELVSDAPGRSASLLSAAPSASSVPSNRADLIDLETGTGRLAPFLAKLFNLVSESETDDIVHWVEGGKAFRISDPQRLTRIVLPRYFKHNKLGSFTQQLHTYGFTRKCDETSIDGMVFTREFFRAGAPEELYKIRRGGLGGRTDDLNQYESLDRMPASSNLEDDVRDLGASVSSFTPLHQQLLGLEAALSTVQDRFHQQSHELNETMQAIGQAVALEHPDHSTAVDQILRSSNACARNFSEDRAAPASNASSNTNESIGHQTANSVSVNASFRTQAQNSCGTCFAPSARPTLADLTAAAEDVQECDERHSENSERCSDDHSSLQGRDGSDGDRFGSDDRSGSEEDRDGSDERSDSAGRSSDKSNAGSAGDKSDKSKTSNAGSASSNKSATGSAADSAEGSAAGSAAGSASAGSGTGSAGSRAESGTGSAGCSAAGSAAGSCSSGGTVSSASAVAGSSASGGGDSSVSANFSSSSVEPRSEPSVSSGSHGRSISS